MQKIIKYLLISFLSIIVTLFAIYVIFIAYISSESLRKNLSARLSLATGYSVNLQQAPKVSFFPELKASFNYITLQNKKNVFLKADKIEIDFSFWQALKGIITISDIKIIKPHFFVYEPITDVMSFIQHSFLPIHKVRNIIIEDGIIHYTNKDKEITHLNGNIFLGVKKQKPTINLTGDLFNQKFKIYSEVTYNLANNILQFNNLAANLAKQELKGALQILAQPKVKIIGSVATNNLDLMSNVTMILNNLFEYKKRGLNLDIRLSSDIVNCKNFSINNLAATIQLNEKGLNLNVGNAKTNLGVLSLIYKLTPIKKDYNSNLQLTGKMVDYSKLPFFININGQENLNFSLKQKLTPDQIAAQIHSLLDSNPQEQIIWQTPANLELCLNKGMIESYNLIDLLQKTSEYKIKKIVKRKIRNVQSAYQNLLDLTVHDMTEFKNLEINFNIYSKYNAKFSVSSIFNGEKHNIIGQINKENFKLNGKTNDINYWIVENKNVIFTGLKN